MAFLNGIRNSAFEKSIWEKALKGIRNKAFEKNI
jgi:hypothetical protein